MNTGLNPDLCLTSEPYTGMSTKLLHMKFSESCFAARDQEGLFSRAQTIYDEFLVGLKILKVPSLQLRLFSGLAPSLQDLMTGPKLRVSTLDLGNL